SSGSEKEQTAAILDWPEGRWLVGALGAGLIAWGAGKAYRGITTKFEDDLRTEQMSARTLRWVARIGVVGYLACAVVYALVGVVAAGLFAYGLFYFVRAAYREV